MVLFFGPAGSGKSVQGQLLSARHGWRWISAGQLLRDSHDPQIMAQMQEGKLIDADTINELMGKALVNAKNIEKIVLDGYPRQLEQVKWLHEASPKFGRAIELAIVLEVPKNELIKRLQIRGRRDDNSEAIENRLADYRKEIYPILSYLTDNKVPISHVDGTGSVGTVHDRIQDEIHACIQG